MSLKLVDQAIASATPPLGVRLLLAPDDATQGRCGETELASCAVGKGGATLICK